MKRDTARSWGRFRLGALYGMALLKDMFSSVNNRVNGFERNLRTGRYTRTASDRAHSTDFSGKRHGAKERARRVKQLNRIEQRHMLPVTFVGPHPKLQGQGALARDLDGVKVRIQMNDLNHPHSAGWHAYNASHWAVGYHGRKPVQYHPNHGPLANPAV
jgi:hypothetical protein